MELIGRKSWRQGDFIISTDKDRLDVDTIHDYLSSESYWAEGRSIDVVRKSIEHSLCFGVYKAGKQAGFGRVVTDYATFAWLCDVFILDAYRGLGLGKWLIECVTRFETMPNMKIWILATKDAHELYRRYGAFETLENPERWMIRWNVDDLQ